MRILFLVRQLTSGGAERQLLNLARGLRKRGHTVAVVTFYPGGLLAAEIQNDDVLHYDLGKAGRWDVWSFSRNYIRLIKKFCPDIVYSFLPSANLFAALLRFATPSIRLVWGIRASNMQADSYDWLGSLIAKLERVLARRADLIIVNSQSGLRYHLQKGYPQRSLEFIANGVDDEGFQFRPEARARLRERLGVGEGVLLLGCVGRLDLMKGHKVLIRAVALVPSELDFRLLIVGADVGGRKAALQGLARSLGIERAVLFHEPTNNIGPVYSAVDILVSSSLYGEGFSNVICEASLCGCPCIASDVGDAKNLIEDARWIVPPGNVLELCRAIQELARQLPQVNRNDIRSHMQKLCALAAAVGATEVALQNVLDRRQMGLTDK